MIDARLPGGARAGGADPSDLQDELAEELKKAGSLNKQKDKPKNQRN
jgi:hypothetical protein